MYKRSLFNRVGMAAASLVLLVAICKAHRPGFTAVDMGQAAALGDVKPRWYDTFSVSFNESTKIFVRKHTHGTWYYDFSNRREAVVRNNGRGDRYCGSIHPFSDTPCTHLVVERLRYLIFPGLRSCCACCTAEKGCGVLSNRWLDTATFLGEVEVRGRLAYKWSAPGLQNNYYYVTADTRQVPLELDQEPNDNMSFDPSTFTPRPPPAAVFDIPDYCYTDVADEAGDTQAADRADSQADTAQQRKQRQQSASGMQASGDDGSGRGDGGVGVMMAKVVSRGAVRRAVPACPFLSVCTVASSSLIIDH